MKSVFIGKKVALLISYGAICISYAKWNYSLVFYFYLTFKTSPSCFFTVFNWDLINILRNIKTSTNDAVYTSGNHFQIGLNFSNLTLNSKENWSKFCGNVNKPANANANANVGFMNF